MGVHKRVHMVGPYGGSSDCTFPLAEAFDPESMF